MTTRPFYFIVVLWGERFRDYFLDYCLPSLLSPNNIPALDGGRINKFLIATRPDDWAAMTATPIFKLLERYIEPVYIEIPACPPDKSGCQHMGIGHKLASEMAHRDKAYATMITPDLMLSDGTVAKLQDHARAGVEIVLTAALRFGEEPFLANLEAAGAIPPGVSRRDTGTPLVISGRQMVAAAINGMHSETQRYEWGERYFSEFPVACWWRVPDENGIIVHSMSWAPLLIDYGTVETHDTSALENWTIDGDYIYKNIGNQARIHVVDDSDEMFVSSWTPLADKAQDLTPSRFLNYQFIGLLIRGGALRNVYYSGIMDPLKRRLFLLPVRWHARSLNVRWDQVERRAGRVIRIVLGKSRADGLLTYAGPSEAIPAPEGKAAPRPTSIKAGFWRNVGRAWRSPTEVGIDFIWWLQSLYIWWLPSLYGWLLKGFGLLLSLVGFVSRVVLITSDTWYNRRIIIHRFSQIVRGDRYAMQRATWRVRMLIASMFGKRLNVPEPEVPIERSPLEA